MKSNGRSRITIKEVMGVLHADLIGKDSHRGITLTYGWMANQVGHFALGFIPAYVVYLCSGSPTWSFFSVAGFWLAFEIYNAMSPLYKDEYRGNGSFRIPWKNLLFDTFTDLTFFWLGSLTFYLSVNSSFLSFALGGVLLLYIAFATRYWFLTKLYQQNAYFPYQFRLSQWDAPIRQEYVTKINEFLDKKPNGDHFIIFGEIGKGKTRLSVGIANELSIRWRKSLYTTLTKIISLFSMSPEELDKNSYGLWNWRESDFLLIDDMNPGAPPESNKFTASDVSNYIRLRQEDLNLNVLRSKSVIWVVGSLSGTDTQKDWYDMVQSLGIAEENIKVIDLNISGQ